MRPPRLSGGVRLTSELSGQRANVLRVVTFLYWAAVIGCACGCLALPDNVNYPFWAGLFALTLPWSLIPWWFTWALMHSGVGAGFLVGLGIGFAVFNSVIMWLVVIKLKRRHEAIGSSPASPPA